MGLTGKAIAHIRVCLKGDPSGWRVSLLTGLSFEVFEHDLFKDRPYVYVRDPDGQITKVYRSYADYCD